MSNTFKMGVYVYRTNAWGDCSLDGITSKNDRLEACWNTKDIYKNPDPEIAKKCDLIIRADEICGGLKCIRAWVVDKETGEPTKRWGMCGGNFIYSSDGRFPKLLDFSEPIQVMDRFE